MIAFQRDRLPGLRRDQWREVQSFFEQGHRAVMPHELANSTSLDPIQALSLLACLAADVSTVKMLLLVYHSGCSEAPIASRPVEQGWPSFPVVCDFCGEAVSRAEARYQLMARIDGELPLFDREE